MGLIDHHQIPGGSVNLGGFGARELVRADNDLIHWLERAKVTIPDRFIVGPRFQDLAVQKELLVQLLMPLLSEVRGGNDEDSAFAFGPLLRDHKSGFNGLAQADLIRQQGAFGERRAKREQSGIYLMRVQIHLSAGNRAREFLHAVGGTTFRQIIGKIFSMVVGQIHTTLGFLITSTARPLEYSV